MKLMQMHLRSEIEIKLNLMLHHTKVIVLFSLLFKTVAQLDFSLQRMTQT